MEKKERSGNPPFRQKKTAQDPQNVAKQLSKYVSL